MNEPLVKFKTAKLAKEKMFNWNSQSYYTREKVLEEFNDGNNYCNLNMESEWFKENYPNAIIAPSQSLLAKWLRDVHRLHITIIIGYGETTWYSFIIQSIDANFYDSHIQDYEGSFNTHEDALEVGLFEALSLILTTKK